MPAATTRSTTCCADAAGTAMTAMLMPSRRAIFFRSWMSWIGTPPRDCWPDLRAQVVEERDDLEPFLTEARVVGERETEIAGADDRHAELAIEAENLAQVALQIADVVADAADAELAEVRQVLANLRGVQVELLGERLRRDGRHAGVVERVQAAQVDRQAIGGQLGDLIGSPARPAGFVRAFHKLIGIVAKDRVLISRSIWPLPPLSPSGARRAFQPYVPPSQSPAEFTLKAVVIGVLFGLLFGASTVYLGLRAGLTVSASIPIAVLAISVLKKLGGSTILENNIVQTIGSAGESVAGGVVFTIPALIFLTPDGPGYFNYFQITMLAFAGRHPRRPDDGAAAPRADREGARRAALSRKAPPAPTCSSPASAAASSRRWCSAVSASARCGSRCRGSSTCF